MQLFDQNRTPRQLAATMQIQNLLSLAAQIFSRSINCCSVMALAGTLALAVPSPALADDRVFPVEGAFSSGQIKQVSPEGVRISVRNKDVEIPIGEIRKITFDGEPRGLDRAREFVLNEQFDQAIDELGRIDASELKSDPVKVDFEFYTAFCEGKLSLAGKSDPRAAAGKLVGFSRKYPTSHHFYDTNDLIGQLAESLGQNAQRFYATLAASSSPSIKAKGAYRLGYFELGRGNVQPAQQAFQTAVSLGAGGEATQRYKRLSQVGLARCQIASGDAKGALEKLNRMVETNNSKDLELFAYISNARGAANIELGKKKEALIRFLQTDLLFFEDQAMHAEALYHLSKLWREIGESTRGAEAKSKLDKLYGSSAWAQKE